MHWMKNPKGIDKLDYTSLMPFRDFSKKLLYKNNKITLNSNLISFYIEILYRVPKVYANYSMNLKITSCIDTAQACNTSRVQKFCQVSEFV